MTSIMNSLLLPIKSRVSSRITNKLLEATQAINAANEILKEHRESMDDATREHVALRLEQILTSVSEIHARRSVSRANRALRLSKRFLKEVKHSILPNFISRDPLPEAQDVSDEEDLADTLSVTFPTTASSELKNTIPSRDSSGDSDDDWPGTLVFPEVDDELERTVRFIVDFL